MKNEQVKHQSVYRTVLSTDLALLRHFFLMVLRSLSSRREGYLPFLDTLNPNQMEIRTKL